MWVRHSAGKRNRISSVSRNLLLRSVVYRLWTSYFIHQANLKNTLTDFLSSVHFYEKQFLLFDLQLKKTWTLWSDLDDFALLAPNQPSKEKSQP